MLLLVLSTLFQEYSIYLVRVVVVMSFLKVFDVKKKRKKNFCFPHSNNVIETKE
jgi:hypothetical protein